jgi:hypothetical protein
MNFIFLFFIFLCSTSKCYSWKFEKEIIGTLVSPFLPQINLHHIVVFKRKNHKYLLDYSPLSELNISTCLKLFAGKNVPGKTRIVYINDKNNNNEILIEEWIKILNANKQSGKFPIRYYKLNKMIKEWDESFNLYHHNCRHFSSYIIKSC